MRRECRERFQVSDPNMHHGTCVTHVPWFMPGSLTSGFLWVGGGENFAGIPGACATRLFTYLVRGPWAKYDLPPQHWKRVRQWTCSSDGKCTSSRSPPTQCSCLATRSRQRSLPGQPRSPTLLVSAQTEAAPTLTSLRYWQIRSTVSQLLSSPWREYRKYMLTSRYWDAFHVTGPLLLTSW